MQLPGMLSLGGGLPNPSTFPISSISFTLRAQPGEEGSGKVVCVSDSDVQDAMQYGPTDGHPPLVKWIREVYNPHFHPYAGQMLDGLSLGSEKTVQSEYGMMLTTGSQDALTKVFEMLLDEEDSLLVEDR